MALFYGIILWDYFMGLFYGIFYGIILWDYFMGIYGFVWGMYGCIWVFMGMYGYICGFLGMYGYIWICMGMYGYIYCLLLLLIVLNHLFLLHFSYCLLRNSFIKLTLLLDVFIDFNYVIVTIVRSSLM